MSGATFKPRNQAPRDTPAPFSVAQPSTSLGAPNKNFPENHPAIEVLTDDRTSVQQPISSFSGTFEVPAEVNEFNSEPAQSLTVERVQPTVMNIVQPGEYHPGYAEQMLQWFDRPKTKKVYDSYTWKSGAVSEKERFVPNTPPHFSEFARSIGVTTRTLKKWARDHQEFRDAYQACEEILEEFLIDNGLVGAYGAIAMKFVAVNRTKMKDKVVTENVTIDINKVLDGIAAGKVKPGGQLELPEDDI